MPVPETTVAAAVLLLLQVPLPASLSEMPAPTHTVAGPDIMPGTALTVTTVVAVQPTADVNVILAVPAVAPPVTIPEEPAEATAVLLLLQVPVPPSVRLVVSPAQTLVIPVIAAGKLFTVMMPVAAQPVDVV